MENDTLERRLARLEREARRWRWAAGGLGTALLGVVAVAATAGPGVADVVRARRVEVVDGQGRPRVTLRTDPHTQVVLTNEKGEESICLTGMADGGGIVVGSPDGMPAAILTARQQMGASLSLARSNGDSIDLATTVKDEPGVLTQVGGRQGWIKCSDAALR